MADEDRTLTRIDAEIAAFRQRWLLAYDAGHDGECCWLEDLIDRDLEARYKITNPAVAG